MNLLSRLRAAGELLFHHDYRAGHFQDLSGQGKHGTPSGGVSFRKQGLFCDGVDGYINCGADHIGASACSVLACGTPRSRGGGGFGRILDNAKVNFYVGTSGDRLVFRGDNVTSALSAVDSIQPWTRYHMAATRNAAGDETNLYIDGALSGTANQDSGTPAAGSNIIVANWTPSALRGWHGDLEWVVVVSRVLTPAEIQEINTELEPRPDTREVIREIDSSYDLRASHLGPGARVTTSNVTAGQIPGTPFWVSSGAFSVDVDTVNGKPAKVLTCQTAGVAYAKWGELRNNQAEAAYGTFDFWLSKEDVSGIDIAYINIDPTPTSGGLVQDGYRFSITTGKTLINRRRVGGVNTNLFTSSAGAFPVSTWANCKITRSPTGEFSFYLNGVLVPAATGTNPHTDNSTASSRWFVIELDAGDKIALAHLDGTPLFSKHLGVV